MAEPTTRPRLLPPHLLLLALLAQGALAQLPAPVAAAGVWRWWGVLPLLAGIGIMSWGAALFARHETAIRPLEPSSVLVVEGPFRYSRNPMYLGMLLVLAGVACLLGSPWPWLLVGVFAIVLERAFIRHEEALLRVRFGEAYDDYRRAVRRWL